MRTKFKGGLHRYRLCELRDDIPLTLLYPRVKERNVSVLGNNLAGRQRAAGSLKFQKSDWRFKVSTEKKFEYIGRSKPGIRLHWLCCVIENFKVGNSSLQQRGRHFS